MEMAKEKTVSNCVTSRATKPLRHRALGLEFRLSKWNDSKPKKLQNFLLLGLDFYRRVGVSRMDFVLLLNELILVGSLLV